MQRKQRPVAVNALSFRRMTFANFAKTTRKISWGIGSPKSGWIYISFCVPPPLTVPFCPVRDSKKERDAFNEHLKGKFPMSLDECLQRRRFGEAEDILEQIA